MEEAVLDRASGRAAIPLVSAWVHENHAVFGQLAMAGKSNAITAMPKLLEMLDLRKATVTIDAMGGPKDIAQKVADRGETPQGRMEREISTPRPQDLEAFALPPP